ncbi:hypothetical protein GCM10011584_09670 [Nocardioides phosphati]|uniref:Uncharacterized protein n=1 Tax=Nocardioides phosphati TaxID=1867775 RepID=A0ABQ2N8D7_9ACTN|nr:hypothetical protein [Nocardioides phosphati]GGO86706.1 hypothetical protein GCM10011584_09670 [Nocardioides phosphati]
MSEHEPAPLVEQIADVLAAYHVLARSDGRQRDAHLALQLARLVEREKHDAWEEGYLRGTLDTTSDLEPADNPYARD